MPVRKQVRHSLRILGFRELVLILANITVPCSLHEKMFRFPRYAFDRPPFRPRTRGADKPAWVRS